MKRRQTECPYTMNAPESLEGWQAASAIDICASQLRMAQGRVVGLDLNAWMLACECTGLDRATAIDLFPAVEAGLMSTLRQDTPDPRFSPDIGFPLPMAERNLSIRLSVVDGGKVKAELSEIGEKGALAQENRGGGHTSVRGSETAVVCRQRCQVPIAGGH